MAYYIDLFSPETYEAFLHSDRQVTGFRKRSETAAKKIRVGDRFICYMTKLSRWFAILEVVSPYYEDTTPRFLENDDPFIIRFKVKTVALLDRDKSIPIKDPRVWDCLSFTKDNEPDSMAWTGKVRGSMTRLDDKDGHFLEEFILSQQQNGEVFPLDEKEYQKLAFHQVRRVDKVVTVTVPESEPDTEEVVPTEKAIRESIKIQALLAEIGTKMGMKIWLPRNDRSAVLTEWKNSENSLLTVLPLNYDDTTLKTIEQIDVIWLRGRSIARAFEVEHTTSIYSGILRMADLLALQPNMDIKLHIVAPYSRREKVFQELRRPVFSLLEKGPLYENCTYLSYDSIHELAKEKHLNHLSDTVLDDYAEIAEM